MIHATGYTAISHQLAKAGLEKHFGCYQLPLVATGYGRGHGHNRTGQLARCGKKCQILKSKVQKCHPLKDKQKRRDFGGWACPDWRDMVDLAMYIPVKK